MFKVKTMIRLTLQFGKLKIQVSINSALVLMLLAMLR